MRITHCRSCGSDRLHEVLDLGQHPLNNALLTRETLNQPEPRYPLELLFCDACSMLQVSVTIPPDVLYKRDYPYFSSASNALLDHAKRHVDHLITDRKLGPDSLVIEVASNDGYLLQNFVAAGIPVLGIDPADAPAAKANRIGVPTRCDFFSLNLANRLVAEGNQADVTIASNVVAHVDQINDFVAGFKRVLKPGGVAIFEFAYAVDTIEKNEFDQIYHEHLFYHTLHGLKHLFERHGLYLNDAEHLSIHGGSLRVRATHDNQPSDRLLAMIEHEKRLGVNTLAFYRGFAAEVARNLNSLKDLLAGLEATGKRVACYGAASKGATLLNTLDMPAGFFEFVVDQNPFKRGKFLPGQKIPILGPRHLLESAPDYCLILVWNFADEVMRTYASYVEDGGRFIVPVPRPRIIDPNT